MKYILITLGLFLYIPTFAYPQEVPCRSGETLAGKTCHKCFDDRFYVGDNFDHWDKFYSQGQNVIFSSSRSRTLFDLNNAYITHAGVNDDQIVSTYMPSSVNNAIIFANKGFSVVGHPASRNDIAGRIMYNVYYAKEQSSGTKLTANWNYTNYVETTTNGRTNIVYNKVDLGTSTKFIDASQILEHNECFNMRVDFCGDTVKNGTEVCDYNDPSKIGWGTAGCTASCQANNSGTGTISCGDGIKNGTEVCDYNDANKIGWGTNGCTTSCQANNGGGGGGTSCGDGIKNGAELCDYNDPSKIGWGTNGCTTSCQPNNGGGGGGGGGGSTIPGGGGSTIPGGSGTTVASNICGDGKLQRPNAAGINEECDFGSATNWGICNKKNCTWGDLTQPGVYDGDITVPNGGSITFGPKRDIVIGHGTNPFMEILQKPYIKNDSDFDLYFDELCVSKYTGISIVGVTPQCKNIGVLSAGEKLEFDTYPEFLGNKNAISGSYGDNILITTFQNKGTLYDSAYFAAAFKVRVSNPSIATTGGGTSYIKNTSNIANIQKVADENRNSAKPGTNTNFVGTSVSSAGISSSVKNVTDSNSIKTVANDINRMNNDLNALGTTDNFAHAQEEITNIALAQKFNGIENVFIIKNKDLRILQNTFAGITSPRTYIIENGNLFIDANINYPSNIAFVVKGGNINIAENVTVINGTYITMKKGLSGGKIIGTGDETKNVLKVKGALYGDISLLVSKRIYIKDDNSGQIGVGTIVSFGSNLFRKPAPLTGQFIDEYMQSMKIAK